MCEGRESGLNGGVMHQITIDITGSLCSCWSSIQVLLWGGGRGRGRGERGYNGRGIQDRSTLYFPFYHWGRILKCNCDKSLRSFPPCHSQSPLLMDFTPPPLLNKSGLKLVCNVKFYMETSSLRILKVMPRNLIEIVRSWIQLLVCSVHCLTCTVTIPPQHSSTLPPPSSPENHQEPDNDNWGPLWVLVVKYSSFNTVSDCFFTKKYNKVQLKVFSLCH